MHKDSDFADITPMIIAFSKGPTWYHPYINEYYTPEDDSEHDNSVYRLYLENAKGQTLGLYFKSKYIDKKVSEWLDTGNLECDDEKYWPNKNTLFKKPFVDPNVVYDCIAMTLLEDVWGPTHPSGGFPTRTSKEWNNWIKDTGASGTNQFCFSKTGKRVSNFFRSSVHVTMFSLDCGMTTDGKSWWCDS